MNGNYKIRLVSRGYRIPINNIRMEVKAMADLLISLSLSVDICDYISGKRFNSTFINNTSKADHASLPYVKQSILSACDALKADIEAIDDNIV